MNEKSELIRMVKHLADDPIDIRNGSELIKLMDYYGVSNLAILTTEQIHTYWLSRVVEMIFENKKEN